MAKKNWKSTDACRRNTASQSGAPATGGGGRRRGTAKSETVLGVSVPAQPQVTRRTSALDQDMSKMTRSGNESPHVVKAIAMAPKVDRLRFDKQERLLHRFYEPLVLLHTLDPIRGAHLQRPTLDRARSSGYGSGELRRTFVDKLAYICDYKTGGESVTAIALQRLPEKVVFVVAANNNVRPKVTDLLRSILLQLKDCSALTPEQSFQLRDKIGAQCIDLSKSRIEAYRRFLREPLRRCIASLQHLRGDYEVEIATELSELLDFEGDMHELCRLVYTFRKSKSFVFLNQKVAPIRGSSEGISMDSDVFAQTRHYIGRLGSHLTAAKTLVDAAKHLPFLFDDIEIRTVPSQASSLPPACIDDKVTLDGIVKRMMPSNGNEEVFRELKDALQDMNEKHNLETRVREAYQNKNFQPQVYAEVVLLEYFYINNLDFVDDDRYIGCSKPACYCCWLYIRAHPGRFAEPACHSKIYLNWKPPSSCGHGKSSDEKYRIHIRNILNEMVKTVRADAGAQIMARSCRRRSHPDSTTGNTASMDQANLGHLPQDFDAGSQISYSSYIEAPAPEYAQEKLKSDVGLVVESSEEDGNNESESEDSDDGGGALLQ